MILALTCFSILVNVVMAVLGVRVLWVARQSRKLPDLLISVFYLSAAAAYLLVLLDNVLPISEATALAMSRTSEPLALVPSACLALFTWRVFRRESRWAPALVSAILVALIAGSAWTTLGAAPRAEWPRTFPFWLDHGARTIAALWTAIESLSYYRRGRRRVAIEVLDPQLHNRFLIFGIWALASVGFRALRIAAAFQERGSFIEDLLSQGGGSLSGLVGLIAIWLLFFPPSAYRRRVDKHGEQLAAHTRERF